MFILLAKLTDFLGVLSSCPSRKGHLSKNRFKGNLETKCGETQIDTLHRQTDRQTDKQADAHTKNDEEEEKGKK